VAAAELVLHVVLAAAAFMLGYLLGRLERMTASGKTARQRWLDVGRVAFGVVVVAVVVISYWQDRQRVMCERAWFVQATEALRERSFAAGRSAADQIVLLESTLSGDPDRARQATRDYIAALHQAEAIRQATPIPVPPEC
jgi:hypothetical protein